MSETLDRQATGGAEQPERKEDDDFLVVGLGASAGGIKALKDFFAHVPADSGMAYVVILHLSPDYESRLAEVLQQTAAIPVTKVTGRVRVAPNHVYVIPPSRNLALRDGHLSLSDVTSMEMRRAPVDIFFRTLAQSHESRAVCVVLSGTGANGSMGMKRVKEAGGICLAQDPQEAEYTDMPRHSIATGLVDYVLPVAEMPAKIIAYKEQLGQVRLPAKTPNTQDSDERALRDIFTLMRTRTGHDFSNYKRATVLRRIERRMNVHELTDLPAYARLLRERPAEARALLKDLLISVTNFFRDREAFAALEQEIIPRLFDGKGAGDHVRVWVAGCATGEEAYTLAMLLCEHAEGRSNPPALQVFATDIDEPALAAAREGFYTVNDAADVSPERLRRFFVKGSSGYQVSRALREMVLFAQHNIIKDPPFSHLDLITCRNLLIYLNRAAQERLARVFHFALNPGGYLFLSLSESIDGPADLFVKIDKEHNIFQSRPVEARVPLSLSDFTPPPRTPEQTTWQVGRLLEEELERVKAQLRATVEQYEIQTEELKAANEELQAANEELRSTAEEMETGKEELQSVNEELTTVNQELKIKIEELSQANNDFRNLMAATEIGTLFLDRALRVKLFTPSARAIFNLIPADVGRPLSDITNKLRDGDLTADVERVSETLQTAEREVLTEEGRWYLMRLLPYRTAEDQISGVVITFLDITRRKQTEAWLRRSEERLRLLAESVRDYSIIIQDTDGRIEMWNKGAERMFGFTEEEAVGQHIAIIFTPEDRAHDIPADEMRRARADGRAADERWHLRQDGSRFYVSGVLSPLYEGGALTGYAKIARDLTEEKQAEAKLRQVRAELEERVRERTLELAESNVALAAEVAERRTAEERVKHLLRQLVGIQEDERRRIARDLHDHLGQQLTALRLNLEALRERCGEDEELYRQLEQTQEVARRLDADVDFLAWELRPAALDDLGLVPALTKFIQDWSQHFRIPAEFHHNGLEGVRLAPEIETNLYRIAQEALNNIYKHARARRADLILERRDNHVALIVEDDGAGFDANEETLPAADDRGMGLIGMRERAALIGGTLEIETAPGGGTTIFARVPVRFAAAEETAAGEA